MSQAETSADRLRIVVLAGGDSAEREVSLESGRNVADALQQRGHQVQLLDPAKSPLSSIAADTDIVLPMLHGTGAEDGVLQTQLDQLGIPWLGSSAEASRLTFNKIATRTTLQAAGLLVPPGVALNPRERWWKKRWRERDRPHPRATTAIRESRFLPVSCSSLGTSAAA